MITGVCGSAPASLFAASPAMRNDASMLHEGSAEPQLARRSGQQGFGAEPQLSRRSGPPGFGAETRLA